MLPLNCYLSEHAHAHAWVTVSYRPRSTLRDLTTARLRAPGETGVCPPRGRAASPPTWRPSITKFNAIAPVHHQQVRRALYSRHGLGLESSSTGGGNTRLRARSGPCPSLQSWSSAAIGPQLVLGSGLTAETRCRGANFLANSAPVLAQVSAITNCWMPPPGCGDSDTTGRPRFRALGPRRHGLRRRRRRRRRRRGAARSDHSAVTAVTVAGAWLGVTSVVRVVTSRA